MVLGMNQFFAIALGTVVGNGRSVMRGILITLCVVFVALFTGCTGGVVVSEPAPTEECETPPAVNGACESNDECAPTDFCLEQWCDVECRDWNRCVPRLLEGDQCDREAEESQCAVGLVCHPTADEPESRAGQCHPRNPQKDKAYHATDV